MPPPEDEYDEDLVPVGFFKDVYRSKHGKKQLLFRADMCEYMKRLSKHRLREECVHMPKSKSLYVTKEVVN